MDPLSTITASAIANLAFSEFIKSGAGEFAKKSIGGVIELVANLRNQMALLHNYSVFRPKALLRRLFSIRLSN
jgi:hypothetical protein